MAKRRKAATRRAKPPAKKRGKRVARRVRAFAAPAAVVAKDVANDVVQEWRYLQSRRLEDIAQAFVSLTSELWIVKDRMAVLEQVLDRHGIPAPKAVEAFMPEGEFKTTLDAERSAWARRMIAALFPKGLPKVE